MIRGVLARDLVLCAHSTVAAGLRAGACLAAPVPTSLMVLAELRRGTPGLVADQASVRQCCAALALPLADADPPPPAR